MPKQLSGWLKNRIEDGLKNLLARVGTSGDGQKRIGTGNGKKRNG